MKPFLLFKSIKSNEINILHFLNINQNLSKQKIFKPKNKLENRFIKKINKPRKHNPSI